MGSGRVSEDRRPGARRGRWPGTMGRGHAPVFSELEGLLSQNTAGSSQWFPPWERLQKRRGRAGEASERDRQDNLGSSQGWVSFQTSPLLPKGPSSVCSYMTVLLHGEQGWRSVE